MSNSQSSHACSEDRPTCKRCAPTNLLIWWRANWDMYLAPAVSRMLPVAPHTFMLAVGIVEILAGLLVAVVRAYVVALWLWGIIINLFLVPGYYDIALRDFGLSLGALALARL